MGAITSKTLLVVGVLLKPLSFLKQAQRTIVKTHVWTTKVGALNHSKLSRSFFEVSTQQLHE